MHCLDWFLAKLPGPCRRALLGLVSGKASLGTLVFFSLTTVVLYCNLSLLRGYIRRGPTAETLLNFDARAFFMLFILAFYPPSAGCGK